ncbi:MAG: hypothetical protein AAFX10_13575 [Pseudomonadota bacterium]
MTWFSEDSADAGNPGGVREHNQRDRQGAESLRILPEGQRPFVYLYDGRGLSLPPQASAR